RRHTRFSRDWSSDVCSSDLLTGVHKAMQKYSTPYTKDGRIPYYFDANGRYEKKETLERLLDHARKIGAFDQIAVVEEPFDEFNRSEERRVGKECRYRRQPDT